MPVSKVAVALLDEAVETAIFDDGGSDLQAACEGVHATDVRVEEVHRFERTRDGTWRRSSSRPW